MVSRPAARDPPEISRATPTGGGGLSCFVLFETGIARTIGAFGTEGSEAVVFAILRRTFGLGQPEVGTRGCSPACPLPFGSREVLEKGFAIEDEAVLLGEAKGCLG
jgi:hypothetical protein